MLGSFAGSGPEKHRRSEDQVFDGAKQSICSHFLGDNVGQRSAGRAYSSETNPMPDASVYGGAFRGWKNHCQR
jgi:hypothetical protein